VKIVGRKTTAKYTVIGEDVSMGIAGRSLEKNLKEKGS